MTLVRWNPVRDLAGRRFDSLMQDFFGDNFSDELVQQVWIPRSDIVEDENTFKVYMDLPGMRREDLEITLEEGVLNISGERANILNQEGVTTHQNERAYGKFTRNFRLDGAIDTSRIDAQFKDGVLVITLPKLEEAKPRKIEIKAR